MKTRTFSLRNILIIPFFCQIVFLSLSISYFSFKTSQRSINDIASQLSSEIGLRVENKLINFLSSFHLILQVNNDIVTLDKLALDNPNLLQKYFWKRIQKFPNVDYICWANERGEFYGLKRQLDDSLVHVLVNKSNNFIVNYHQILENGKIGKSIRKRGVYDPRNRPWYQKAVATKKQSWSDIFIDFDTTDTRIITATYPLFDEKKRTIGVLGTTITFDRFNEVISDFKVGKTGQILIVDRAGVLIANSQKNLVQTEYQFLNGNKKDYRLTNSTNPLFLAIGKRIETEFNNDLSQIKKPIQIFLNFQGKKQFIQLTPISDKFGLKWFVIVVVPESDFMERIYTNYFITIVFCVVALVASLGIGVFTARLITQPILEVNLAAKSLAKGNWRQKIEIARTDELGDLAKSFNSMADQLEKSFVTLEAKNKDLKRLDKLKDEFLANTSHELRTPLNGIIGIAESLLDGVTGTLSKDTCSNLSMIAASGRRLSNLVNDLLDFSRLKIKTLNYN